MKHTLLFLLLGLCATYAVQAQSPLRNFKGRVVDSATLKPLQDATVSIFRANDTMLLNFGFTTPNGNFSLSIRSGDSLLIIISLFGYDERTEKAGSNESGWSFSDYGDLKLAPLPVMFKGYTAKTSAIRMKGDTIEINASRFKVLPGSDVAQLFKKIPGFEVSVKGEIKVNGTAVTQITVDGSDFFGNNPGLVSKNLNADMIETVQVYEERNADGSPKEEASKVINLKLKKGKRNGSFGDAMAGYGNQSRYESGVRYNSFKNDRKLSFIVNSNNINETGFDFGFENWHNARSLERNGSGDDGFYSYSGATGSGNINHKTGSGFTYFNEYKGKKKLSVNFFANRNDYSSISASSSENPLNDSTRRLSTDSSNSNGLALSSSMSLNFSQTLDSTGGYDFGVNASVYDHSNTIEGLNEIRLNRFQLNKGLSAISNRNLANDIKVTGSYRRSLRKNKRYSFFLNSSYKAGNNSDRFYQFLENSNDTFNNLNERSLVSSEWLSKVYLAMPLSKKIMLNLSADRWQLNHQTEQITNAAGNRYSGNFEQEYVKKIDTLSIAFNNRQVQYSVKPFLSYQSKRLYTQAGVTLLNLDLRNSAQNGQILFEKNYPKWLPFYSLSYYPSKAYVYLTASKSTVFPGISDLLPVLNLSNNYERRIGNQLLQPTDQYSFRTYTSMHKLKGFKYFYFGASGSMSDNAKIWVNRQDENGIIFKTPENAAGKKNLSGWLNASKKLSKIANFEFSVSAESDRNPLFINGISTFGNNRTVSANPAFNLSYSDSLDLSLGLRWDRNRFENELNTNLNYIQDVYSYFFETRTLLFTGTELNTSVEISDQRSVPGIGKVVAVWNAYIQHPLSAKSPFKLKLTAYDILKQNTSISRYSSDNFIYISQSNRLQQYFMLTLVYKIRKMGGEEALNYVY